MSDTPPQPETPVQLLFALGQLTGTVGGLQRAIEGFTKVTEGHGSRIDKLESDNDRRKGQNTIITIAVSAGVSLGVVILGGFILYLIKGS